MHGIWHKWDEQVGKDHVQTVYNTCTREVYHEREGAATTSSPEHKLTTWLVTCSFVCFSSLTE